MVMYGDCIVVVFGFYGSLVCLSLGLNSADHVVDRGEFVVVGYYCFVLGVCFFSLFE